MEEILQFLVNAEGLYDLGSIVKLFLFQIGIDGLIMMIYALVKGFHGK